ncbi:translocation/assembly module TamB domain-containing protein [Maribellus comscasis]|uniref:translocation/assembly module TamB domain-containing protein n=1 Tax=Maribellus comscasis TaxID=2681766 RepID=UPI00131B92DD|nr:translocation/assembly module TamB domain-containing protein [Maribellus comscasis]
MITASLKGKAGKVVFDGKLKVPEANIYLPAVMNMTGRFTEPDIPKPVLVREIENFSNPVDTAALVLDTVSTRDTVNLQYLDGLTGLLTVEFPQNTWIKNKDMFVEISGELEVIKNAEFFELFGSIDVVRGQYDILGKTFKIDQGTITFQGGEELIPRLNIQATYSFRNPEEAEQALTLNVTGTANGPEINFALDGSQVSEGDALSYILFGKGMNELTIDQQENVSGAGQLAGSAAMAVLSSQLTNLLGNSLDVDYIEVKGNGDFDNATVVVGKYITNNLFVSYQQRFGETNEKDVGKYEVKLEYELFKFLFLQLNNSSTDSGFDVIFKLQSN